MTSKAENVVRNALAWSRALAHMVHEGKDKHTLQAAANSADSAAKHALEELDDGIS